MDNKTLIIKCENCGKEFKTTNQRLTQHKHNFCSKKCMWEYRKKQTENDRNCICDICGKSFHRKPSNIKKNKNNVCSKECLKELQRQNMTGENNHQYGLLGDKNASWKDDSRISPYGYKLIRCLDHPFKNINGFVFEHRLVAEKYLLNKDNSVEINGKKYLKNGYVVHHIDFNRLNNKVDNLYVLPESLHQSFHNYISPVDRDINTGRFIKNKEERKLKYSNEELRDKFFDYIKEKGMRIDDRNSGGFGSTGKV